LVLIHARLSAEGFECCMLNFFVNFLRLKYLVVTVQGSRIFRLGLVLDQSLFLSQSHGLSQGQSQCKGQFHVQGQILQGLLPGAAAC
jgi:hypothetical protein